MPSHTITPGYSRLGERISKNVTITADGEMNFDAAVPGSGNVVISAIDIDVSALASVFIHSDQTVTLTTNDDGTPDDTLTITADKPLMWYSGCGLPNPFASGIDISSIKLARGSAGDAAVKIRILQDATP